MFITERLESTDAEASTPTTPEQPSIKISKSLVPAEMDGKQTAVELFTVTLGDEAILLVPLKTWSQLDVHKWRVQGRLPGTPAGLEVGVDHVKLAGETVYTYEPDGCERLEKLFNDWLALERQNLEAARQKAQSPAGPAPTESHDTEPLRFHVELDKTGQAHVVCLEGKETVANVALTVPGLNSLFNQGLMRKPGSWKIGALRDWVELDGKLFKFKEADCLGELEHTLNEQYLPELASDVDVVVFANPASTSGLDIQFPAADNGLAENRRRHLDAAAMELLSDPRRCRVLCKGIVVKLAPPNLIFKQKTVDGGERELDPGPDNTVYLTGSDGQPKIIDLSQPVSHLGLDPAELTAIFNHPAVNRRAKASLAAQNSK